LYQESTMNCNDNYKNYSGTWYCSKITVCEPHINKNRICIETRGCATEAQCTMTNGEIWNGEQIYSGTEMPAGMTMTLSCCQTKATANDDAAVIDYAEICNSSSQLLVGYSSVVMALAMSVYWLFI
jgi:hypothetical protein